MDPGLYPEREIVMRMKWLDSSRIILVNTDGVEKIVNIDNNFQEESYCKIPFFDSNIYTKDKKFHFYFKKPLLFPNKTLERLKGNYESFISAYYTQGIRSQEGLYNILFSVDF